MLNLTSIVTQIFLAIKISMWSISSFGNLIMTMIFNLVEKNYLNILVILFLGKHLKESSLKLLRNFNIKKKWALEISFGLSSAFRIRPLFRVLSIGSKLWTLTAMESSQATNSNTSMKNRVRDWHIWKVTSISTLKTLSARWLISSRMMEAFTLRFKTFSREKVTAVSSLICSLILTNSSVLNRGTRTKRGVSRWRTLTGQTGIDL